MSEDVVKYSEVNSIAKHFISSGLFTDTESESVAVVKIMAGLELGLKPFQSMQSFDIIQGKVFVKPIMLSGLLKKNGKYDYRIIISNDSECSIEFFEHNNLIGVSTVTYKQCEQMGITTGYDKFTKQMKTKDNWKKQPGTMLYNRAMSQGIRRFAPDLYLMPIYTEGDEWWDNDAPKNIVETKQIEPTEIDLLRIKITELRTELGYDTDKIYNIGEKIQFTGRKFKDYSIDTLKKIIVELELIKFNQNEVNQIAETIENDTNKIDILEGLFND